MRKGLIAAGMAAVFALAFAAVSFADVPPPPVNQKIGIPDSVFNDLDEAGCRFCHDNPEIVSPPPDDPNPAKWNVNRHHLLYGKPLDEGFCSVNSDQSCVGDDQCNTSICSRTGNACTGDGDCPSGETCGETCIGDSIAPYPPAADGTYQCTTCHLVDGTSGMFVIEAVRNCLACHEQVTGEASVHHLSSEAQSQNCQVCHGDVINNPGDGHIIPTYSPSLVTPAPSGGKGTPLNRENNGAGACNYCHSTGTGSLEPGTVSDPEYLGPFGGPVDVYRNATTHHNTGLGVFDNRQCLWCHNIDTPAEAPIRRCENCHGFESLHNIALDSDDADTEFKPGEENPGWSHIGNNTDCWGCHGFSTAAAAAPMSGPTVPYINSGDTMTVLSGTATQVTLSGSNFLNTMNETTYTSGVSLTDSSGDSVMITADSIDEHTLVFTIPGTIAEGNYDVRAVKEIMESNPYPVAVIPDVTIDSMTCSNDRVLTISGSNFGEQYTAAENYINVEINGASASVRSWTDSEIRVSVPECSARFTTVVNALFGAESKECGKGCIKRRLRRR